MNIPIKEVKVIIVDSYHEDELIKNELLQGWNVDLILPLIRDMTDKYKLFLSRPYSDKKDIISTDTIDKISVEYTEVPLISRPRRLDNENLFGNNDTTTNKEETISKELYGVELLMSKDLTKHRGSSTGYRGVYYIKNRNTTKRKYRAEIKYKKYNFSKTKVCNTLDEAVNLRLMWEQELLLLYENKDLAALEVTPALVKKKATRPIFRASEIVKPVVATDIKYTSKLDGSSCLVRHINSHIISSTRRLGNNINSINRICISNEIRNLFFRESTKSIRHKENGKPSIDARDATLYDKWSKFMNDSYLKDVSKL